MRQRAPRGHERFQSATSPLGQGPDANRNKNPAASLSFERASARQSRSLFPSHREHQLPINGFILRDAASRNDRPLLSRLVSDAADRPAAFPSFHLLHLQLLSSRAKRTSPQNLVAHLFLYALRHGHRYRHLHP